MIRPRITFFCDLELEALQRLFADTAVIDDLLRLQAGVRIALLDLSPERADVVRRLNDAGIPVITGLLFPKERGLFLTMENAPQVVACYTDFQAWTARNGLRWAGVGLDIELDVREFQRFASNTWQALLSRLRRGFDSVRLEQALAMYRVLVARMHADGYSVDSYQFPAIVDVRRAGSRLAQHVTGMLDIPVDREVLMTYSSVFVRLGQRSYRATHRMRSPLPSASRGGGQRVRLAFLSWTGIHSPVICSTRIAGVKLLPFSVWRAV